MKNIVLILLVSFIFISCSEEIEKEDNNIYLTNQLLQGNWINKSKISIQGGINSIAFINDSLFVSFVKSKVWVKDIIP